jgi:V8-like Glu-specific endopeptidase
MALETFGPESGASAEPREARAPSMPEEEVALPWSSPLAGVLGATLSRYEGRQEAREARLAQKASSETSSWCLDTEERVRHRLARLGLPPGALEGRASFRTADIPAIAPRTGEPLARVLERLMGTSDLVSTRSLELGLRATRSVARIRVRNAFGTLVRSGTGFLVSPRLLLTNHHVLRSASEAEASDAEFELPMCPSGEALASAVFQLDPSAIFLSDDALDFALVAVKERSASGQDLENFGWNRLLEVPGKVLVGEYVSIVSHPPGEPQQLALRENQVIDVFDDFLHYRTAAAPGVSGAPVFNEQWEVVALHHSGVPEVQDGRLLARDGGAWSPAMGEQRIAWRAHEGVRVEALLRVLRETALSPGARRLLDELREPGPTPVADHRRSRAALASTQPLGLEAVRQPIERGCCPRARASAQTESSSFPRAPHPCSARVPRLRRLFPPRATARPPSLRRSPTSFSRRSRSWRARPSASITTPRRTSRRARTTMLPFRSRRSYRSRSSSTPRIAPSSRISRAASSILGSTSTRI